MIVAAKGRPWGVVPEAFLKGVNLYHFCIRSAWESHLPFRCVHLAY